MFFEIDDIKRRHSNYYDVTNVFGWVDTPESEFGYNYLRGVAASLPAFGIGETWKLYRENWRLLGTHYEKPANGSQFLIYARSVFGMENFYKGIKNRLQHAASISVFDFGIRWAVYRWCTEGLYKNFAEADVFFWKRILPTLVASAATSWMSVPFEVSRACYYGDRTYPKHLQKGYTSPFNALMRIPREEGPWHLFKGGFPIISRNFVSFSFLTYLFDFSIDKLDGLRQSGSVPENLIKWNCAAFASFWATFAAYPWGVTVRDMVELYPRVNGKNIWRDNYRKAAVWLWYYPYMGNYWAGFGQYCAKTWPTLFLSVWLADSFGLFAYHNHDYHTFRGSHSYEDNDE